MKNLGLILMIGLFAVACENKESADLASAQNCLDNANQETALSCLSSIESYSSEKANALKCSIYFLSGGLTTKKIVDAYEKLKDKNNSKEAVFISALTLDGADSNAALATATKANSFCSQSGLGSLIYIGGLSLTGTSLYAAANSLGGVSDWNPSAGPPSQTQVDEVINACQNPANASSCNLAGIGGAAQTISNSYCTGANTDTETCKSINTAVTEYGENSGAAMLCLMQKKTFTPPSTCT